MPQQLSRRELLKLSALFAASAGLPRLLLADDGFAAPAVATAADAAPAAAGNNAWAVDGSSNFKAIYGQPELRSAFLLFLRNVFHLYPEQRFHDLIGEVTRTGGSDSEIYLQVQRRLPEIKPLLADIRYAIPALRKQKREMARQTLELLGATRRIDGYLEIGSTGRYAGRLKDEIEIEGEVVLLHTVAPSYAPVDVVERGQPFKLGRYVPLNDYAPVEAAHVADASIELIGNFIGFHHAPPDQRDAFVASLHRVLRRNGRLVLRDHDVDSPAMNRMAALAHDVFNLGIGASWGENEAEIRNFTSVAGIVAALERVGFRYSGRGLLQEGDPTRNALMEFVKA